MAENTQKGNPGDRSTSKTSRRRSATSGAPRHRARATRTAGERMRSRLLDAASALFKAHGLNGTSITAIAGAADAFPSQVTYYFRTKEALFVEAACRDMLHLAERAEKAAALKRTPTAYVSTLIASERLHVEGARAYAGVVARHGWRTHSTSEISARRFWTIALGITLEGHAVGRSEAAMSAAMREALGALAEARTAEFAPATLKLRLVTRSNRPSTKSR